MSSGLKLSLQIVSEALVKISQIQMLRFVIGYLKRKWMVTLRIKKVLTTKNIGDILLYDNEVAEIVSATFFCF